MQVRHDRLDDQGIVSHLRDFASHEQVHPCDMDQVNKKLHLLVCQLVCVYRLPQYGSIHLNVHQLQARVGTHRKWQLAVLRNGLAELYVGFVLDNVG